MAVHGLKSIPTQRTSVDDVRRTDSLDSASPSPSPSLVAGRLDRPLPRSGTRRLSLILALGDLAVLVFVCVVAMALRQVWPELFSRSTPGVHLVSAAPVIVVAWLACNIVFGAYSPSALDAGTEEFRRVATAAVVTLGVVGAACYLSGFDLSRGFLVVLIVLGIPALLLARVLLRRAVVRLRARGALRHRVLIAGAPSAVDSVARALSREPALGFDVIGAAVPSAPSSSTTAHGVPVIAGIDELVNGVRRSGADVLFLAAGSVPSPEFLRDLMWDLEELDVQLAVAPTVSDVARDRVRIRPVGGLPMVHIDPPRGHRAVRFGKRAFDVAASSALLLGTAPLFAVAALQILRADAGPVFFRQRRVGRDGVEFSCLKFRTMVVDAESQLTSLRDRVGEAGLFKLKDDPRITRPGAFLRRYSIDELPQLLNVWKGEMSLVGPRPPLREEVDRYPVEAHRRLRVRPGLTGLWQVSGRSDLSFEDAIRLDLYYVDNWSVFQDLSILWKTVGAVAGKRGAY